MNITNEEKSKAQITLEKCKTYEKDHELIPVKVAHNTWVMLPKDVSNKQILSKVKKYNHKEN